VAKGQHNSNREKKRPKQDKKKVPAMSASPFVTSNRPGNPSQKGVSKKRR
jgi:hypothetical protein